MENVTKDSIQPWLNESRSIINNYQTKLNTVIGEFQQTMEDNLDRDFRMLFRKCYESISKLKPEEEDKILRAMIDFQHRSSNTLNALTDKLGKIPQKSDKELDKEYEKFSKDLQKLNKTTESKLPPNVSSELTKISDACLKEGNDIEINLKSAIDERTRKVIADVKIHTVVDTGKAQVMKGPALSKSFLDNLRGKIKSCDGIVENMIQALSNLKTHIADRIKKLSVYPEFTKDNVLKFLHCELIKGEKSLYQPSSLTEKTDQIHAVQGKVQTAKLEKHAPVAGVVATAPTIAAAHTPAAAPTLAAAPSTGVQHIPKSTISKSDTIKHAQAKPRPANTVSNRK